MSVGSWFQLDSQQDQVLKGFIFMMLGLEESGEKDIHVRVVFGFRGVGGFERGQGDLLVVFMEGVSDHPAITGDTSIKEPWSTQKDVTSIHGLTKFHTKFHLYSFCQWKER